jgi:hypothetical protein
MIVHGLSSFNTDGALNFGPLTAGNLGMFAHHAYNAHKARVTRQEITSWKVAFYIKEP